MDDTRIVVGNAEERGAPADTIAEASTINLPVAEFPESPLEQFLEINRCGQRITDLELQVLTDSGRCRNRNGTCVGIDRGKITHKKVFRAALKQQRLLQTHRSCLRPRQVVKRDTKALSAFEFPGIRDQSLGRAAKHDRRLCIDADNIQNFPGMGHRVRRTKEEAKGNRTGQQRKLLRRPSFDLRLIERKAEMLDNTVARSNGHAANAAE